MMIVSSLLGAGWAPGPQVLGDDGEFLLCRASREGPDGALNTVLAMVPGAEQPTPASLERLAHEYALKDAIDGQWAVRPLELVRERGRTILVLEDPGGEPLDRLVGAPMEVGGFLRLAITFAAALGKVHQRGLVHKDIKPAHILVNGATGEARLTGFGIASRLPRERQPPEPPETIAGTLAYMAPEQTGRMNRSIDSRSDLYSLGVTLYQTLTGSLPFATSDSMEWVHCHIARTPVPPGERSGTVPGPVSAVVMKLLAKTAEDRYQTAGGLERDLRRCLDEWEARRRIDGFPLGEYDTPDRLLIPEKLYGRAREIETLLTAFDRVVRSGPPELVLVAGHSGVGKSAVIHELHKVLVPPRGLFGSGKFDQHKRDIPYSTLAQAFRGLIRPLLGKSDAELSRWRDAFRDALGPNGQLMVDLVPDLKLIVGDPPPVPELPPQDAQRRFQRVFRRFINVFARPEHPLALFLDDLQWLDAATLDLLEHLLTRADLRHLMLIGAYRDNEVDAAHPLMRKLAAIRQAGGIVQKIALAPLAGEDVGRLMADALRCAPERVILLAQLVHERTAGNPLFIRQFIDTLVEEGLLAFDHAHAQWTWDIARIHLKGYTDNVVELMAGKLGRLPPTTRNALQQLACLGNVAKTTTLGLLLGASDQQVHSDLWEAVRLELVERLEGSYRFVHDRVQEAAYSLIPEPSRAEAHLCIGSLLAAQIPAEQRDEMIFEIVNQLNRGVALITARDEREQLAELNLTAGKRAKASAAYASALGYLSTGAALMTDDCWERRHRLAFELALNRAECEFLTGELAAAEERVNALSRRAADTVDRASVACLRMDVYTMLERTDRAVNVGLECLRSLGADWVGWSPHPTAEEMRREYEQVWSKLADRPIEGLIDLPLMSDPASLATLDVLTRLAPPAFFTDANLHSLITCRQVNLSLEHGNSDGSCVAYIWLGLIAARNFDNYEAAAQFGRLGYELVEGRGLKRYKARTYMSLGTFLVPWTTHIRSARELARRTFEAANESGDLTFASYSREQVNSNMLACGDPLAEVQREAESGLEFAQKTRFSLLEDFITGELQLIRMLRGLTPAFGCFDDVGFEELAFERHLSSSFALAMPHLFYWLQKLQARCLANDYATAIAASKRVAPLVQFVPPIFEMADYHYYSALARAALYDSASPEEQREHAQALAGHHRQLAFWATHCPENFENRTALVGAEIARVEGRELDAMRLYEQAIRSAGANGFVHNEAIANELAARFYAARGFEKIAHAYLLDARYGYLRWGADGKVRQLERLHPRLLAADGHAITTTGAAIPQLDVATVVKASQAVSGEMLLPGLIETLMRIALQSAGADRGLLVLSRDDVHQIEAEALSRTDQIEVALCQDALSAPACPEPLLRHVIRARESVIIDDAARPNPFCDADYVQRRRPRSILCLPLMKQGRLVGLLYLENTLASHAFTPDRVAVLKVLASQAAISLENTRLYGDLREREARIRRLVDSNIVGVLMFDLEGRILDANQAFLDIVGYDRDELAAGRMSFPGMTPAEWRAAWDAALVALRSTGSCRPFEQQYIRKDDSRVPVLIAAAMFDGAQREGVAFVLDLTARKQAEEKYRSMMEQAHDAILVLDGDGVVVEANRQAAVMLARQRDAIVGHPLAAMMEGRAAAALSRLTGSTGLIALHLPGAEGRAHDFEVSAARVSVGCQDAVMLIARDVSQRLLLEQQLRQSQKMDAIGQLTGGVAHDFNNLLTVIIGTIGLLMDAVADPKLVDICRMIEEAGLRGAELTRQLLAFARRQPLHPRDTDINALILKAAKLLKPTLGEQVEIEMALEEDCWHAMIDPGQLDTTLLNLAVNARDAMPDGGRLRFSSANVVLGEADADADPELNPGPHVSITVSDTGTGMPTAIRERAFEPFFTTKEIGKGTGLGLSMVYGFVKQSGGSIRIDSKEGCGTTVTLYLPPSREQTASADARAAQGTPGGKETILVVEDDALVHNYVVSQLRGFGYATIAAASGRDALALVDQGARFDLLFTDLIMPDGMNGRQLADEVARRRPGVAVLYTSGYPDDTLAHHGRLDPGIALLGKPYGKADLAHMIRQALASRGADR
jgi:PAS domain S-box-containing protein